jgi:hypothetical protein
MLFDIPDEVEEATTPVPELKSAVEVAALLELVPPRLVVVKGDTESAEIAEPPVEIIETPTIVLVAPDVCINEDSKTVGTAELPVADIAKPELEPDAV